MVEASHLRMGGRSQTMTHFQMKFAGQVSFSKGSAQPSARAPASLKVASVEDQSLFFLAPSNTANTGHNFTAVSEDKLGLLISTHRFTSR